MIFPSIHQRREADMKKRKKELSIRQLKLHLAEARELLLHHKRGIQSLDHVEFNQHRDDFLNKTKGVV